MAKANSFKNEPWTSFERGSYSVFTDDFISDKLIHKFSKKSANSTIEFKETFNLHQDGKIGGHNEELKFWFPINSRTLYGRIKNSNWKVHLDNGTWDHHGLNLNLYGSLQGKPDLGEESLKVGLEAAKDNWKTNIRATCNLNDKAITLYNKTYITQDSWKVGLINAYELSKKQWNHSAIQISKEQDCCDVYLRANAGKKHAPVHPTHYIEELVADYIYKYSPQTRLGVEVSLNLTSPNILNGAAVVWDHKCLDKPNTGIKIKADLKRNISVGLKNNITNYGNYLFGLNISDFGQTNRFGYGVQLNLDL